MKNDVYALLYAKGTETGKDRTESAERKKKAVMALVLGAGLPLFVFIAYQYLPAKFQREITADDRAAVKKEADEKKLEALYSNAGSYGKSADLGPLETAFLAERPGNAATKEGDEIAALVKNGADVLAYHSVGRISDGKVVDYDKKNFKAYSPIVGAVISTPGEFLEDITQSMKKGRGTVIALIGSVREHYNILPDGSTDPNCSAGILDRFGKEHPEYAGKLKVVFFHPYSQDSLFGQPEYEAEKYAQISRRGWKNAFLGINLRKDELAKPLVTEEGWRGGEFWPEGPGITNFSPRHISLDKELTGSKLKGLGKGSGIAEFYWLPWATIPKDSEAVTQLAREYALVFAGYSGGKAETRSQRVIPAKIMGSR